MIRRQEAFPKEEFRRNVVKSVRAGHIQTSEHWTGNWKTRQLTGRA